MKRIFLLFALAAVMVSVASAESLPDAQDSTVFAPQADTATPTPAPTATPDLSVSDGALHLDFDVLTPDNPAATPVAVDPIDKPTPTPTPAPNFIPDSFVSESMGISFSYPYTWLLNPNTNQDTTIQFVEPKSEMMEPNGYQTRITVEKVNMGLDQTASDANEKLESTLDELAATFTSFTANDPGSAQMGDAHGYYCYYRAEYNDGTKTYSLRGRIMIVAQGKALYQVRITTPSNWYSYYEYAFRLVRDSFRFL